MDISFARTQIPAELRRECEAAIVDSVVKHGRASTVQKGARLAVDVVLAVLDTATQAAREVHNHGADDSPGLNCPELRLTDGSLLGSCMLPEPAEWAYGVRHDIDGHISSNMTETQARGYARHPDIDVVDGNAVSRDRHPVHRRLGPWESNPAHVEVTR